MIRRDNPNNSSTRKLLEWMTCRRERQGNRSADRPTAFHWRQDLTAIYRSCKLEILGDR